MALLWTGLLFQVVMPLLIVFYTAYLFVAYSISFAVWITVLVYLFYLALTMVMFLLFVLLLSERTKEDLSMMPWIVFSPLFAFVCRVYGAFATLWELLGKGHRDTNMAPWWVTRKSKF